MPALHIQQQPQLPPPQPPLQLRRQPSQQLKLKKHHHLQDTCWMVSSSLFLWELSLEVKYRGQSHFIKNSSVET